MKYMNLITKMLCLILILGGLYAYQNVAEERAALAAEREEEIAEVEAWNAEVEAQKQAADEAAELATHIYVAGTWEGTGDGYGGPIVVSVTTSEKEITDIQVTSHEGDDDAYYDMAYTVVDEVLKKQSTDVDTVSGATFSSEGILTAVDEAIGQAKAAKEAENNG